MKREKKYTKGEWNILPSDYYPFGYYILKNDFDGREECDAVKEDYANAQLISAAPDLLEALQNLMGIMDTPIARRKSKGDSFYKEAIESAYSAINKAL